MRVEGGGLQCIQRPWSGSFAGCVLVVQLGWLEGPLGPIGGPGVLGVDPELVDEGMRR